jgi:hypothetical protein
VSSVESQSTLSRNMVPPFLDLKVQVHVICSSETSADYQLTIRHCMRNKQRHLWTISAQLQPPNCHHALRFIANQKKKKSVTDIPVLSILKKLSGPWSHGVGDRMINAMGWVLTGENEVFGENLPHSQFSPTAKYTWLDMGSRRGRRDEKTATQLIFKFSYGTTNSH